MACYVAFLERGGEDMEACYAAALGRWDEDTGVLMLQFWGTWMRMRFGYVAVSGRRGMRMQGLVMWQFWGRG